MVKPPCDFLVHIKDAEISQKMLNAKCDQWKKAAKDGLQNHKYKSYGAYFDHELNCNIFSALKNYLEMFVVESYKCDLLFGLIKRVAILSIMKNKKVTCEQSEVCYVFFDKLFDNPARALSSKVILPLIGVENSYQAREYKTSPAKKDENDPKKIIKKAVTSKDVRKKIMHDLQVLFNVCCFSLFVFFQLYYVII